MSSPLATFDQFDSEPVPLHLDAANIVTLIPSGKPWTVATATADPSAGIGSLKFNAANRDNKLIDFLLLGIFSVLVHNSVIDHFKGVSFEQEIVEPVKQPPKVQITLSRPQPKPVAPPPPVVAPKPPVQKAVPLKPPKPKPVQKVIEQAPTPTPEPAPISNAVSAEPAPAAPAPPPAPVVEEKITEPVADAAYLHNPLPEYPELAQERGWEGKVVMKVHVLPDGRTDSVVVVKSSGQKVLDDAAVKAVYKWSFVPAKKGETPIARYTNVPFTFKL